MSRRKTENLNKDTIPGSIFVRSRNNLIYFKLKGVQYATGLTDSPKNREIAKELKKQKYLELIGVTKPVITTRLTLRDVFDEFINEHCVHLSNNTIRGYVLAFRRIIVFDTIISQKEIEIQVLNLLYNNDLKPSTINDYLRAFQVFLNWLLEKDYLQKKINIFKNFKKKDSFKPIKIYTDYELNQIIEYTSKSNIEFSLLIQFMIYTGARIGEALSMDWSQVDFKNEKLYFLNKINKTSEYIPLSEPIINIINQLKSNKEKLFRWKPSTASRLLRKLYQIFKELNINRDNRGFHEFRKTFLYKLYQQGTPLQIAQKLMRHKTISITIKHYTFFDDSELKKNLDKLNFEKPATHLPPN